MPMNQQTHFMSGVENLFLSVISSLIGTPFCCLFYFEFIFYHQIVIWLVVFVRNCAYVCKNSCVDLHVMPSISLCVCVYVDLYYSVSDICVVNNCDIEKVKDNLGIIHF